MEWSAFPVQLRSDRESARGRTPLQTAHSDSGSSTEVEDVRRFREIKDEWTASRNLKWTDRQT